MFFDLTLNQWDNMHRIQTLKATYGYTQETHTIITSTGSQKNSVLSQSVTEKIEVLLSQGFCAYDISRSLNISVDRVQNIEISIEEKVFNKAVLGKVDKEN